MKDSNSIQPLDALRDIAIPKRGEPLSLEKAMCLAISQAYLGAARVSPNPLVGCVVLDANENFLACGYHEFYGGPHAEVNALKNLSEADIRDGHLIVTLEPCAHEGKTPSCAKMIAKTSLRKITYGVLDPNPLVAGQGIEILRAAGKEVQELSTLREELEEVCEVFLKNFRKKEVFVALKMATTLDGKTSELNGNSQWITNSKSRDYVHYLRSCYDGVMVGAKTILKDNAKLNIRSETIKKLNKVVILDRQGDVLKNRNDLAIFNIHAAGNIYLFLSKYHFANLASFELEEKFSGASGLKIFACDEERGHLNLNQIFKVLWQQNFKSLLVESGGELAASLLNEKKVDRLHLFFSTQILGPGKSWSEGLANERIASALRTKSSKVKIFGDNFYLSSLLEQA